MSLFHVLPSVDELEKKAADKVVDDLRKEGISHVPHIGTWRWYEDTQHLSFSPSQELLSRLQRSSE